jgi:hypothetical protein
MTLNPKLSTFQVILSLVIACSIIFWITDSPWRSLTSMRSWVDKHQDEWSKVQNKELKYKYIQLGWSSKNGGTIIMSGYTYDEKAKNHANDFVRTKNAIGHNFENEIEVYSKEDFDTWRKIIEELESPNQTKMQNKMQ